MAVIKITPTGEVITRGGLPSCTCCNSCNISWDTSVYTGQLRGNPWTVSNGGARLRVDLEDSGLDIDWQDPLPHTQGGICGDGSNPYRQRATATATIAVVGAGVSLGFSFSGIAERHDTGYENISFYLDGVLVASATSPGGKLKCLMGPALVTYHVAPPYALAAGGHTMSVVFDSRDPYFHVDSYYQADFTCGPALPSPP